MFYEKKLLNCYLIKRYFKYLMKLEKMLLEFKVLEETVKKWKDRDVDKNQFSRLDLNQN